MNTPVGKRRPIFHPEAKNNGSTFVRFEIYQRANDRHPTANETLFHPGPRHIPSLSSGIDETNSVRKIFPSRQHNRREIPRKNRHPFHPASFVSLTQRQRCLLRHGKNTASWTKIARIYSHVDHAMHATHRSSSLAKQPKIYVLSG